MTEPNSNNLLPKTYSYLLRLLTEGEQSGALYQIVLINLQTGSRRGFVDFEQLAQFLKETSPGRWASSPKEANEPFT